LTDDKANVENIGGLIFAQAEKTTSRTRWTGWSSSAIGV